jgi:hypothetical protein
MARLAIGSSDRVVREGQGSEKDGYEPIQSANYWLEAVLDTGIALVYRICDEQFCGQRFS